MNDTNITVTMPISEYDRLRDIANAFYDHIRMFEAANENGVATMTKELKQTIEDIYL